MITEDIREARQKLVLDHFHHKVRPDWDDVLATFPHPRYEIIPTMRVHDGDGEVRGYYHDSRVAFPDQDHELIAPRHSDDAVIAEFWLLAARCLKGLLTMSGGTPDPDLTDTKAPNCTE
ncbi:hypothetical protein ACIRU8_29435 [Streptomyces sp. NPDC101175]|uniref:hypothetical protein n=1 Tax=Streptomyces sp. NPDC101175 TaxID=3366123 RepID=UPI0038361C1B